MKLLNILKINHKKVYKYSEKNIDKYLSLLSQGNIISLVSEAGTPIISDPGHELVSSCHKEGFQVFAVPGIQLD
jgi:16S rRNA (cytidine1402-2'-O)-methyltransferase